MFPSRISRPVLWASNDCVLTGWLQITFDDPNSEWEIVNAWFVKQNNFITRFKLRDIVMPEKEVGK